MPFAEAVPNLLGGLCSVGFAIIFVIADPRSPTTRALALAFFANGISLADEPWVLVHPIQAVRYLDLLTAYLTEFAFAEWLLGVARTALPTPRALSLITGCARLAQAAFLVFLVCAWVRIDQEYARFISGDVLDEIGNPAMLSLAACLTVAAVAILVGGAVLFMQQIDPAERVRAISLLIGIPVLALGVVLSREYRVFANVLGLLIFLAGAVRYHGIQGERAIFMSKFLSPQVERLVRLKGMAYAMQAQSLEVTVVCCDLRGFTHFSQLHPSEQVVDLLGEYYATVGEVVATLGATIKDYAGDGILMLVGAPLPITDHYGIGLALARGVLSAASTVTQKWSTAESPLGTGIGVASGRVTVGGIGSPSRMEYTAVGPAVNLASRLCALAADGEILVDTNTKEHVADTSLRSRGTLAIKGMGDVTHFVLAHPPSS